MATPFSTAMDSAETEVLGYITTALPVVLAVAAAGLGIKYGRRFIRGL